MSSSEKFEQYTQPPKWSQEAIWYQILVERFYNGDSSNDPTPENMTGSWPHNFSEDWKITQWTSDWYQNAPFSSDPVEMRRWYDCLQGRRYGGDFLGIIQKLDYIQSLGITAIYLNPINDAPSLHKYDVRNYHHADINFGPDPEGDKLIMSHENPSDPDTWQWTSADLLLLELIREIHSRGMRVILDFSFNHTGIEFWAWRDILVNGINSSFADWYDISMFIKNNPNYPDIQFNSWAGVKELPQLRKKYFTHHHKGKSYQGDMHAEVKKHIFDVIRRWLAPNGNVHDGVDGFRLDVADEIGLNFWQDFRKEVKKINPDAFLVGEVWWENWPDTMMDVRPYLTDGIFDSVMFYQPYKAVRAFFAKNEEYGGAEKMLNELRNSVANFPFDTAKSLMIMSASHDTPRLLTSFFNKNKYKYLAKPIENVHYKTQKPDQVTYKRVKNFLIFQFTMPGSPQIWAGDEMGMWGADDPDCRKPLWWPEFNFEPETAFPFSENKKNEKIIIGFDQSLNLFYRKLIDLRKNHPVFIHGRVKFILAKDDLLIYRRSLDNSNVYIFFNNSLETIKIKNLSLSGTDLWYKRKFSENSKFELEPLGFRIIQTDEFNWEKE